MLINTEENIINIVYEQNISINKIKNKTKTYEYKQINIPVELLTYWKSILHDEIRSICYIISEHNGTYTNFITPSAELPEDVDYSNTDISLLHNVSKKVKPYRVIPLKLRKRGAKNNPKYFIRLNDDFITQCEYVRFIINPYRDDPLLRVKGLVSLQELEVML